MATVISSQDPLNIRKIEDFPESTLRGWEQIKQYWLKTQLSKGNPSLVLPLPKAISVTPIYPKPAPNPCSQVSPGADGELSEADIFETIGEHSTEPFLQKIEQLQQLRASFR